MNRCLNDSSVSKDYPSQFPRPENSSMDPDYQEVSSDTAYYDSTNEMNFLRDCLNKRTVGENRESAIKRTKRSLRAKLLRMIDDVEVCEDEDVLQQLEKSVNSSYSLLTSIKQHKHMTGTFSVAIPERNAPANKKIEVQKRFFFPPNERHRGEISDWQNQLRERRWR